jgi:hypothetical protein
MFWIESNVIPNARWEIKREILLINGNRVLKSSAEITKTEHDFIANYNPVIYCNDLTGEEWCFDTKLPTGGWIENIKATWNKDGVRVFKAVIMC